MEKIRTATLFPRTSMAGNSGRALEARRRAVSQVARAGTPALLVSPSTREAVFTAS